MDGLVKATKKKEVEEEFSFRNYFVPLTTTKAITWITVIGLIVYANMLFNGFVWDDHTYILNNTQLHGFNILGFFEQNIFNQSGQYRPLIIVYFSILYNLFGNTQFFYHFIQLFIHSINACLLFILFSSFFKKKLAFFLSVVFLVHPMQVESVSYIAASASVLLFLTGITAFLIAKNYPQNNRLKLLVYILLLASCLIKETGVLFIFILLLYTLLFNKKRFIKEIFYSTGTLVIYFLLRIGLGQIHLDNRPLIPIARLDLYQRLINIPQVTLYYIKTFLFPEKLAVNQQWVILHPSLTNFLLPFIIDILFLGVLFGGAIFFYCRKKKCFSLYIFFTLWFLAALVLHSQIVPLDMTVADRWFYFDIVGLLGIIGVILSQIPFVHFKKLRPVIITAALIILATFSTRTIVRNTDWQTPDGLFTHDITVEDNFLSEVQLSEELLLEKKYNEALQPAQKSVALFPNEQNVYNLAYVYEVNGNLDAAKKEYYKALQAPYISPDNHHHYLATYEQQAILLLQTDETNKARTFIQSAISDYPDSSALWVGLAIADYRLHNGEALAAAKQAVTLAPDDATANQIYQKIRLSML